MGIETFEPIENAYSDSTKPLNLKKVFFRALRFWYYIPLFLILAIALAIYNYKTTPPEYKIAANILISNGVSNNASIGSNDGAFNGVKLADNNIENQLIILTSTKQIEKTLKQLDFSISYYEKGLFRTVEIYKSSPFKIVSDSTSKILYGKLFCLQFINENEFFITIDGNEDFRKRGKFYEKVTGPGFSFSIVPIKAKIKDKKYIEKEYCFKFNTLRQLVRLYKKKISIQPIGHSSIYELSIQANNVKKGIDFINQLAQNSVDYTLEKKNYIANNTIMFIDNQLIGISDSLSKAKNVLEQFRSQNKLMNVSMQGQMIIQQSQKLEAERHDISQQLDYYKYLLDYTQNNRDNDEDLTPPSSQNVTDPLLSKLISELSTLNAEKASLLFNSSQENPNVTMVERQINTIKKSIIENTKNLIVTTQRRLDDIDNRLMKLS